MVAPADMATMLQNCGFNMNTHAILTDVNHENLTIVEMSDFTDKQCDDLVYSLHKQSTATTVIYIKNSAIAMFKNACFIARHFKHAQQPQDIGFLTRACITDWQTYRKAEAEYADPTDEPKLAKANEAGINDFIHDFLKKLAAFTGTGGHPLAYMIRDIAAVPAATGEPTIGEPNCTYGSIHDGKGLC